MFFGFGFKKMFFIFLVGLLSFFFFACNADIYEEEMEFLTYGYSDPNPIPKTGAIYPYARFERYFAEGVAKTWKMVVMENPHIKLWVSPEIGGKVWGAIHKESGKEFIYFNDVVKFRDVAMRGPWTSGGMEINFGVMGHAPTCASPVDYYFKVNDGNDSVSCFLSGVDLPSNTRWTVEVRLGQDDAFFTTHSTWYNRSQLPQSYYQWMNVGVKTAGNLEYVFPGSHFLEHSGEVKSWPVDDQNRELNWYEKNDFGEYKSFHVFGEVADFWGGYWHDDQFGFGHYAQYDEKLGKKIWIWGLSPFGMIWEDLLTDGNGQYTEIQSGRLFHQADSNSSKTPFKHRAFSPGQRDTFVEYWFPVVNTGGLTSASPDASVYVTKVRGECHVLLSPNREFEEQFRVFSGKDEVFSARIKGKSLKNQKIIFPTHFEIDELSFYLGSKLLYNGDQTSQEINRPLVLPADFSWEDSFGLALLGEEAFSRREFKLSKEFYQRALVENRYNIDALVGLSLNFIRSFEYDEALALSKTALSIDTYHSLANFTYALASLKLGRETDAIDGFSVAALSPEYRVSAWLALGEIYARRGEFEKAFSYVLKAKDSGGDTDVLMACEVVYVRCLEELDVDVDDLDMGDNEEADDLAREFLKEDPLNFFLLAEEAIQSDSDDKYRRWVDSMGGEFPYQTQLEGVLFYHQLGLNGDAQKLLRYCDSNPLVFILLAYIDHLVEGSAADSLFQKSSSLEIAAEMSAKFVFPFRQEMIAPLEWAISMNPDEWKFYWYLGLIYQGVGREEMALTLYDKALSMDTVDFYPFYINYYQLMGSKKRLTSMEADRILALSDDWLNGFNLAKLLCANGNLEKAEEILGGLAKGDPANYIVGLEYAFVLGDLGEYKRCVDILEEIQVLPYEGATGGRLLWRQAMLMLAFESWEAREYQLAFDQIQEARMWRENLGVGRPYVVDERIEDYFSLLCARKLGNGTDVGSFGDAVVEFGLLLPDGATPNPGDLLTGELLKVRGRLEESDKVLDRFKADDVEDSEDFFVNRLLAL